MVYPMEEVLLLNIRRNREDKMTDILSLEKIVEEEISGYEKIEKLYMDKKEILIRGKSDDLLNIDSKILNTFQNINKIAMKRVGILNELDIKTPNMSAIIEFANKNNPEIAKRFEEKKKIINELSSNISKLEKLNLELTKHGINITNKTLEAILKSLTVTTNEYNQRGQNIAGEHLEMSSIVEEA